MFCDIDAGVIAGLDICKNFHLPDYQMMQGFIYAKIFTCRTTKI